MFDITAGHDGTRLVAGDTLPAEAIVDGHDLAREEQATAVALTDEQLVADAWRQLAVAEQAGTRVLGRADVPVVVERQEHALDEVLAQFEAQRSALPVDRLGVRRERRATRRSLRVLGGAA